MRIAVVGSLLFLISGLAFQANAFELPKSGRITIALVEDNLIEGVGCCNEGVQNGAAYLLGEYESGKAVIPLLRLLHQSPSESVRISAALSLIKIGDARGVWAVKQNSRFDSSPRVRELCKRFYSSYKKNNTNS